MGIYLGKVVCGNLDHFLSTTGSKAKELVVSNVVTHRTHGLG